MKLFNEMVKLTMPLVPKPIVRRVADRYIAGDRLDDAVSVVRRMNDRGMRATIDLLGESVDDREKIIATVEGYKEILRTIKAEGLDSNVSIKATAFGLKMDYDFCKSNISELVEEARSVGNFVRLDMEDYTCTDDTLRLYRELRADFGERVGAVIQAYLRRTVADARALAAEKANVRLCKGIYVEPRRVSYRDMACINANFDYALKLLLAGGCYVGIATHDEKRVQAALATIDVLGTPPEQYEFQMLLGVDQTLRDIIVEQGYKLRIYVPFGRDWYPYSTRRLKENPDMAGYVVKAMFKRYEK